MLLPAVALLAGGLVRGKVTAGVFAAALLVSLFTQREFLFRMSPSEASVEMYGENLFLEAIPVASYIREHSGGGSRIAVLGSEPEIYFYSGRMSGTSYIYTYGLMEPQPYAATMQAEMIQEISDSSPEFVVLVTSGTSWLQRRESSTHIFDWWREYGPRNYRLAGVVTRDRMDPRNIAGAPIRALSCHRATVWRCIGGYPSLSSRNNHADSEIGSADGSCDSCGHAGGAVLISKRHGGFSFRRLTNSYLPIQNFEKIWPRISSAVVAPVIASSGMSAP
jgi:hypothetical protein